MPAADYKLPGPEDRSTITCLHCHKPQEVSRKAVSITCRFCNKSLRLDDVIVNKYDARRSLETVGKVDVQKKGHVIADRILCGGAAIRGKVKATITSTDTVVVYPEADVVGDVTAPALIVAAGATLLGKYKIGSREGEKETHDGG